MLKSLPTLVATSNLNDMLAVIEKLPSAIVNRSELSVTVKATKKSREVVTVLHAIITADGKQWSVRAVPGLVVAS